MIPYSCPLRRLAWTTLCFLVAASPGAALDETIEITGGALLATWVQPTYPPAAREAGREGFAQVEFVVDADGRVTGEVLRESTDEDFGAAALAAVRQWRFKPALDAGQPVASALEVRVAFDRSQWRQKEIPIYPPPDGIPRGMPLEPAGAPGGLDPEYPEELNDLRLPGEVRLQFTIDVTGKARDPKILWASHPAFVESALRTLEHAQFTPAHRGPVPQSSEMEFPVSFESVGAKTADILAANSLEIVMGADTPPRPAMLIQPVYPWEKALAAVGGKVVVEFTVNPNGQTEEIRVVESAGADFDAAMVAAADSWVFVPARSGDEPAAVRMRATHVYQPPHSGAEARLLGLLGPGGGGVGKAANLDQKLQPLWRGFPVYPKSLLEERPEGTATIEFIIDRDGRARLPQVVSASAEPFGWAAATAVSQWVFARPRRGGEPIDVTVRIPVAFKAPAAGQQRSP